MGDRFLEIIQGCLKTLKLSLITSIMRQLQTLILTHGQSQVSVQSTLLKLTTLVQQELIKTTTNNSYQQPWPQ